MKNGYEKPKLEILYFIEDICTTSGVFGEGVVTDGAWNENPWYGVEEGR